MPQDASQIKQQVLDYIFWKDWFRTLIVVLAINFAFLLAVVFRMSFTSIICDFLFVYIFIGICTNYLTDSLGKKKAQPVEVKDEDNYKYVSEETVQGIVFLAYIAYKKGMALAKDIILVRDLYNTALAFVALVAITFMSYAFSDKVMVWLLTNCVFVGAYAYSTQKDSIVKSIGSLWGSVQEMALGVIEKIPKQKVE